MMRSDRLSVYLVGGLVVLGFLVLLLWRSLFVVVPPGHVGVLYDLLLGGTRTWRVYQEGLRVKLPWNRMYLYDARLLSKTHSLRGLSREGMVIDIDFTVLFGIDPATAPLLHKEIGPDYIHKLVDPVSVGVVREYVTRHDSHELYTVESTVLQDSIRGVARQYLASNHVVLHDVILQRLNLPSAVIQAIENKLTQEQVSASYEFRLLSEYQEAQRLRIKADGLKQYYSIVNSALTPSLLTWRGIEATVELAQSPNSKLVIVGGGKDQLPLILGGDLARMPSSETSAGRGAPSPAAPAPKSPRVSPEPQTPPPTR